MKKAFILLSTSLLFISCGGAKKSSASIAGYGSPNVDQVLLDDQTFKIEIYSEDQSYGYTKENPVMVGSKNGGPKNERRFLNALTGPNGEALEYTRVGSCCQFQTKNGLFGDAGLLDIYEVSYEGLEEKMTIYINMYDSDTLKVPVGLSLKN